MEQGRSSTPQAHGCQETEVKRKLIDEIKGCGCASTVAGLLYSGTDIMHFDCISCGNGFTIREAPGDQACRKVKTFRKSDTRITPDKVDALCATLKGIVSDLERIRIEVEVLRDANIAMSKTIKKNRYQEK